jgi:alkyldihydroxyacetonephosphate synthase
MKKEMKWWGWGDESLHYPLDSRPGAVEYLKKQLGLKGLQQRPVFDLKDVEIPDSKLDSKRLSAITAELPEGCVTTDRRERILHSCGRGYKDLVGLRSMKIPNSPDAVFFPETETDVQKILRLAEEHRIAIIPFGGGTSVVGGVNPLRGNMALAGTLDMSRLCRVLDIDKLSRTVTAQAGITGPDLEAELKKEGFMLGHYPQSFEYSTLGGWIAPRSCGQNSILYGGIEELVVSLRMISPAGEIETITVPRRADGPDLNETILGSEGVLGVIVSATLRITDLPEETDYFSYAFRNFEDASDAARVVVQSGIPAAMVRVSDEDETDAFIAVGRKKDQNLAEKIKSKIARYLLAAKGIDPHRMSFMMIGLEGNIVENRANRKRIGKTFKSYRSLYLGRTPGREWLKERFFLPYLRDELLDNGIMTDAFETATTWSNLPRLYAGVKEALESVPKKDRLPVAVITHISHLYRDGASLYFTMMARQREGDAIGQWNEIKEAANSAVIKHGGVISHHHGIGLDHKGYLSWNKTGREVIKNIKSTLDPNGIMNPGKLL